MQDESLLANRRDMLKEANTSHTSAKDRLRLERLKRKAEKIEERSTAAEGGKEGDAERKKNWSYSIEDNDRWEKKQKRKASRGDFEFTDYDDVARRVYKKDIDKFKPDMKSYNAQRDAIAASSSSLISADGKSTALTAAEDLYRDANSFVYADHKPTEDQVDRVIGHMNNVMDKRAKHSRKRKNEDEGDVTYINEKNKQFNKKLERYYNKYTEEIRNNFERGTAL
ncbi:mRNA splicing factor SYF2 [Atractiella rhizophila]|nr:mRNA splicing factor SYF2 [Atractiella rhizophila]